TDGFLEMGMKSNIQGWYGSRRWRFGMLSQIDFDAFALESWGFASPRPLRLGGTIGVGPVIRVCWSLRFGFLSMRLRRTTSLRITAVSATRGVDEML
ncbi:MAG: hypothetical protein WCP06_12070, partial [Verrucomicrobiota bacterium]